MSGNGDTAVRRPGGFIITDRALTFCGLPEGAAVLDIGCGSGATVMHMRSHYGYTAWGIDKRGGNGSSYLREGQGERIPWPDNSFDAVMMECSFTLMDDQCAVLKECLRVLVHGGRLIISTIYALGEPAILPESIGRIESRENLLRKIEQHRFKTILFEEYTPHLKTMWGQMIMERGAGALYQTLGADYDEMRRIRCGYCLIIATKEDQ